MSPIDKVPCTSINNVFTQNINAMMRRKDNGRNYDNILKNPLYIHVHDKYTKKRR